MAKLIFRKLFFTLLSLLTIFFITFTLMKFIPGDPLQQEEFLPADVYQALRSHYGFDDPFIVQFYTYVKKLLVLDFGPSLVYQGRSVHDIIAAGFPTSLILGAEAMILGVPLGILLGIIAALKQNFWQDKCILILAVLAVSLPSFIIATLLQYTLGIQLQLLPIARWGTFAQSIMPAISLAALPMAFIARLTRTKMIAEMAQPYVVTARAKGFSEAKIIWTHVLRNILVPVICYLGPLISFVMTGSFVIEKIFSVPGLGYWYITSVLNRDYPLNNASPAYLSFGKLITKEGVEHKIFQFGILVKSLFDVI